ncbi:hypothetical protein AGRA3207_000888 [Actinomadura graeca]|uniref:Uncharacterized protein n=1 Tax=Actinomadura graeca TaxID=2750812 RepID=A0ABX8QN72_9ACTN|nr:hypothetical protein [Actinomadura graeca]QXJ20215.1 hypothetical protein AGRA3207_000888 [Actinomadura graeca]
MAQQQAIIVLVDIANALRERTLRGNVYLFDNMRFLGSTGEGTGDLVTAIPGSYWSDGSQGSEQVLNWLPSSLGSIPPTVPRGYHTERSQAIDRQALEDLTALAGQGTVPGADPAAGLADIRSRVGTRARRARGGRAPVGGKLLDITGNAVTGAGTAAVNPPAPIITDVTGEAVDEKIMYPAQYGSPDMVSDGWYWSATVDTARPGTYAYTMHIQLHELVIRDGEQVWEPVDLTCDSAIRVTTEPKYNAFTGAGLGPLPVPAAPSP